MAHWLNAATVGSISMSMKILLASEPTAMSGYALMGSETGIIVLILLLVLAIGIGIGFLIAQR